MPGGARNGQPKAPRTKISRSISELERELGRELFVKRGKNVALTNHGKLLMERAESFLSGLEAIKDELAAEGFLIGLEIGQLGFERAEPINDRAGGQVVEWGNGRDGC